MPGPCATSTPVSIDHASNEHKLVQIHLLGQRYLPLFKGQRCLSLFSLPENRSIQTRK